MRTDQPRVAGTGSDLWWAVLALTALGAGYATLQLGAIMGTGEWLDVQAALRGGWSWSGYDTIAAVLVALVVVALAVAGIYLTRRLRSRASHVDGKAAAMGDPRGLSQASAKTKAEAGRMTANGSPGLLYGRAVATGQDLYAGWRDGLLIEMGPGAGKTRGVAIPMIIDAPGVVVATSNKRDLGDAIKGVCSVRGVFWVFDPQSIAGYHGAARPPFWWNPLGGVHGPVEANALAHLFADASAPAEASKHSYFDTAGPALLGNLLLAAAVGRYQIDQVYLWLADPVEARLAAVPLLKTAGFPLPAAALTGACNAAPDERSGLFGTAAAAVAFLTSPAILSWITDTDGRPEFHPEAFVTSGRDTLLSLSREGAGTAGPVTTALTAAVMAAAEREGQRHPHGRLPVPLVCVLDEVANVCRWRQLPDLYSFYGSAGITLVSIFQSWAQGVSAFKAHGMQQIWGAATVRIIGAGLADDQHLSSVSKLIDDQYVERRSRGTSTGKGTSRTVNVSFDKQAILSVGELAGLPAGRFVVIPSGQAPVLGALIPWDKRPMADDVHHSIATFEPGGHGGKAVDIAPGVSW